MGTSSIRIRRCCCEVTLTALQKACLPGDTPTDPATGEWWVAYRDDEPVGFVCCEDIGYASGYLRLVGVMPSARGQHLQTRLMGVALRWARARGLTVVVSYTAAWNHASSNNFVRQGWRLYTPELKWGWADALYWRYEL